MSMPRPAGSARAGLGGWYVQRVTSLYLAGFTAYLVLHLGLDPPADYLAWRSWFEQGPVRLAWGLFFVSLLVHAWIGLRSVFMDYLRAAALRFVASLLTGFGLLALALWAAQILLGVNK
ncbi:MAG: succinate dehydrogenase, hydrophobic membrane anchor protein [Gammaproteobacteria bacterium]|nr:succinate dehydrogenase, hydrophobic membrane anchor protein [Gammaproteobacteria bacterium]